MHLPNQNWDRKLSLKTWNFGDCSVEKTVARLSIFGSLLPCIFVVNLALNLEQSLLKLFFEFDHAI